LRSYTVTPELSEIGGGCFIATATYISSQIWKPSLFFSLTKLAEITELIFFYFPANAGN